MKLTNLRLVQEPLSTSIESEGYVWDFHDSLALESVYQNIRERCITLSWQPGGYGELPLAVEAVEISFTGVSYFEVTPRDSDIPDFGEDACLNALSRVSPEDNTQELLAHGVPLLAPAEEQFHIWFEFRGGQHLRIGAEAATFRLRATESNVEVSCPLESGDL